eukprot:3800342-Rhodomonas_salina.1
MRSTIGGVVPREVPAPGCKAGITCERQAGVEPRAGQNQITCVHIAKTPRPLQENPENFDPGCEKLGP